MFDQPLMPNPSSLSGAHTPSNANQVNQVNQVNQSDLAGLLAKVEGLQNQLAATRQGFSQNLTTLQERLEAAGKKSEGQERSLKALHEKMEEMMGMKQEAIWFFATVMVEGLPARTKPDDAGEVLQTLQKEQRILLTYPQMVSTNGDVWMPMRYMSDDYSLQITTAWVKVFTAATRDSSLSGASFFNYSTFDTTLALSPTQQGTDLMTI